MTGSIISYSLNQSNVLLGSSCITSLTINYLIIYILYIIYYILY
nr:MAG TPA: hypothetical protein [Caudoviricetes sp.]